MLRFNPFTKKLDYTNDAEVAALDGRITILENNEYKITYYEIVSGTSGSLTIPQNATINEDEFGSSGNSILSKINVSNKPTYQSPVDSFGNPVTANLLTDGTWTTSGTFTDTDVALIYSITVTGLDLQYLNTFYIIESEELDDWTLGFPTYDVRYAQIGTDGENFEPVKSILNTPTAHVLGERYLIGTSPTGEWVGRANQIAESDGVNWIYTSPILDYRVLVESTVVTYKYNGSSWIVSTAVPLLQGGNSSGVTTRMGSNDNFDVVLVRKGIVMARMFNTGIQFYLNPTAPTQSPNNNSTRIATTAYVDNAVSTIDATADNFLLGGM
jgi:hypothetical protein